MENYYPQHLPENSIQIELIERMAKRTNTNAMTIIGEWVETFSPDFRILWEAGVRDINEFEHYLFAPTLQSNYGAMVHGILVGKRDARLMQ